MGLGRYLTRRDTYLNVGVRVVDGGDDRAGPFDAGLPQHRLPARVAGDDEFRLGHSLALLAIALDDNNVPACRSELLGDGPAEHPVAADDDMVGQVCYRPFGLHLSEFLL